MMRDIGGMFLKEADGGGDNGGEDDDDNDN